MVNEKRLIDANLLLQWVEKLEAYNRGRTSCRKKPKGVTPEGVRHMIDTMPKVDAAEVVRCKDCRKCRIYDDVITRQKQYECRLWHGATREVSADSFCDAGERREGE